MAKYAKIIEGQVEFAPRNKGSVLNYNLDVERMLSDGYKHFTQSETPQTIRMYHFEYVETPEEITEVIVYDETQEQAEERRAQQEAERIAKLSLTKFIEMEIVFIN